MKRWILLAACLLVGMGAATAQNYMVVNSEKIFKSIAEYNTALESLDKLAQQYQQQVDERFEEVATLYNSYKEQEARLSAAARQGYQEQILTKEQAAAEFQESLFGSEGTLMKKRIELIQPIQQRVFAAIESYATAEGFDLVLDAASNPTLLYKSERIDRTEAIIEQLKK